MSKESGQNKAVEPSKDGHHGFPVGRLLRGPKNCITDVAGVKVGQVTLDYPLLQGDSGEEQEYACTGVTAILPHGGNLFQEKVVATSYVINGFGKTTGLVQMNELGMLESPIMLTNTFAVPAVTQGTLQYMLAQNPEVGESTGTINIVVGECNDSYLNSIRYLSVEPDHAQQAIEQATNEQVEEGAVGAGKGMVCFGYKGGIGTSSRIIQSDNLEEKFTLGCLVLSNFGQQDELRLPLFDSLEGKRLKQLKVDENETSLPPASDGSIIIVLATDVPLSERQLLRVAKRCGIGLGRTGSHYHHGSGDIVIAFSTAHTIPHQSTQVIETRRQLREDHPMFNLLFTAAAEATEEAIINSLIQAKTTRGRKGRVVYSLPLIK